MQSIPHRVILSCVPDADLSPNARLHPLAKARKVRQLREFAGWSAREYAPAAPLAGPLIVTVMVCWPKGRKRHDADNVFVKPALDGLTDAHIWHDDRQVRELRVRQQVWSEWGNEGGALYPQGCIVIDIDRMRTGETHAVSGMRVSADRPADRDCGAVASVRLAGAVVAE